MCRFSGVDVRPFAAVVPPVSSLLRSLSISLYGRCSDDDDDDDANLWGNGGGSISPDELGVRVPLPSSAASAFARSSHLPRTVSKLFTTRCDGVHRLAACNPFGLASGLEPPARERELLRASGLTPLREDVRSRRRVWYAKAPAAPPVELEVRESERPRELVDLEEALEVIDVDLSIESFNS